MKSLLPGAERPVVQFEHVGMRYGLGPEVLSDVSFRIAPHSFQFLTGPSGAGKTTLLRLILLSVRPTRGTVSIFGEEVSGISSEKLTLLRRRMGVVFQDFRLLDHLTTYENVALPLRVQGRSETSYRAEVVELLRWVGSASGCTRSLPCSPAVRSSAPPSPARSSPGRTCCWPTSPPATSTLPSGGGCCASSSN